MVLEGPFASYATPEEEEKDTLLAEIFEHSKNGPDVKNRGVIIALGINLVHPFEDGNGRLSRLCYLLFSGQGDNDSIQEVLSHGGRKAIDISPAYLTDHVLRLREEEGGFQYLNEPEIEDWQTIYEIELGKDVSQEARQKLELMLRASHQNFARFVFTDYVLNHYIDGLAEAPNVVNKVVYDREHGYDEQRDAYYPLATELTVISAKSLLTGATSEQVQEILRIYRDEKNLFVRTMIDALRNPTQYPLVDESGWNGYTNMSEYLLYQLRHKKYSRQ
jgi:hypothetical protein